MFPMPHRSLPSLITKEGTKRTEGHKALRNNVSVAGILADVVKPTLGPNGLDKAVVRDSGEVIVTNDCATIFAELQMKHSAGRMIVEAAKALDKVVEDGTATLTILVGELLRHAERLVNRGIHPVIILDGFQTATKEALRLLENISRPFTPLDRNVLTNTAKTALGGTVIADFEALIANVTVSAALQVSENRGNRWHCDIDNVRLEKKTGESIGDVTLVDGVAMDKIVINSAMPKIAENAKIAILRCPLRAEKIREYKYKTCIVVEDPLELKRLKHGENSLAREVVEKIASTGANVVICQREIDYAAQNYLAERGILGVELIKEGDIENVAKATSGKVAVNLQEITPADLGRAKLVEERRLLDDRWVFIEGCRNPRFVTILIRGGTYLNLAETARAIRNALGDLRAAIHEPRVLPGGGAAEMQLALGLERYASRFGGREQFAIVEFAHALEAIPQTLAVNAGADPIDACSNLRAFHSRGSASAGIGADGNIAPDMFEAGVVEPTLVKAQILKSMMDTVTALLRIGDMIASKTVGEKLKETGHLQ